MALPALLTGAVVLAAHWPVLAVRARCIDDGQYLYTNPLVQTPSWASAHRFLSEVLEPSTVEGYYQPLTMISLMLDYRLAGRPDALQVFHRTNLILHVANCMMVAMLLYLLFGRAWVAAGVAILYGVHPLTVEPLCWIGERKTLLASFFALVCLLLYLRYTRRSRPIGYLAVCLTYCLALLSKPTTTPLPLLLLVLDVWPLHRLSKRTVLEKVPLLTLAAVSGIITIVSQARTATAEAVIASSPGRVLLILCHNSMFYLGRLLWPTELSPYYMFPEPFSLANPLLAWAVVGSLCFTAALLLTLRLSRGGVCGWAFFFVAILPTMGLISFTKAIASDKYVYLPLIGLLLPLAAAATYVCGHLASRYRRPILASMAVVTAAIAGLETWQTRNQIEVWRSSIGLAVHMIRAAPNNALLYNHLGVVLLEEGRNPEAAAALKRAVALQPDYLGARCNLGVALARSQRIDEAIAQYDGALKYNPNCIPAWANKGSALARLGRHEEAIACFDRVLQLNPECGTAHASLAESLVELRRFKEAADAYRLAYRYDPNSIEVLSGLAWLLATRPEVGGRGFPDPLRLALRACELAGQQSPELLDTLAVAEASAQRFDQAIATADRALTLARAENHTAIEEGISRRLDTYRTRQPWHDPPTAPTLLVSASQPAG